MKKLFIAFSILVLMAGCNDDDENNEQSSPTCPETCKNGCNSDGSCASVAPTCSATCKNGCNEDGSCQCPESCTDGCNDDGSCASVAPKCSATCKNGCNEDGSCKCPESCTAGCNEDGSCASVAPTCSATCKNGCNEDGSCQCPENCTDGCNDDGSCKADPSDPYACNDDDLEDKLMCRTGAGNCLKSDNYYKFTSTKWKLTKDNETIIYPWHSRQFIEDELLRCEESSLCTPKNYCSIKWGDGTTSWVKLTYFDDGSTEPDTIQSNSHTYQKAGTYTITTDCYFSIFYYSTCHNENCIVDQGHTECDTWCEPSDYTCKGIDRLIEFTE